MLNMIIGRRTKAKLNNKGLSLVELIVTILIMAIVTGGATVAVSVFYNADAERAAKTISSMMKLARERAIAESNDTLDEESKTKKDVYLKLYYADDSYNASICSSQGGTETVIQTEKLGNYKLDLYFGVKGVARDADLDEYQPEYSQLIKLSESSPAVPTPRPGDGAVPFGNEVEVFKYYFQKGTGAIFVDNADKTTCYVTTHIDGEGNSVNDYQPYADIYVEGSSSYHLIVVAGTGRCYISE